MRLKIQVTQSDISRGVQQEPAYCPIALATRRTFRELGKRPSTEDVNVFGDYISVDGYCDTDLSAKAQKFVTTFDESGKDHVKPFSFTTTFTTFKGWN